MDGGRHWRQWTEEQARGALEEFAASGESAATFARRKGVSARRLAYWKKRVRAKATPEFVAVEMPSPVAREKIEIVASGVVVRVREDLDVERVAELVAAIGRRAGGAC